MTEKFGDLNNLIAFLSAEDSDESLLHPQKKISFETTRILEIIDSVKDKSHARDEEMYKQLSTYLKGINKEMITIDDFRDAFKKENIQEETNKEVYTMYTLASEKFEQIVSDFVLNFVKILEWLKEKEWDSFIWLQKKTSDELLNGLNSNIHTFQNIDEVKGALKELSDKLETLTWNINKNKRSLEKSVFTQQMVNFIKKNNLSSSECFDLLNTQIPSAPTVWQRMNELIVKKLWYESLYHHNSGVMLFRKEDNTYDAIDRRTNQLIMSDIEEYTVHKVWNQLLQFGEIAVRKWDERSIFKGWKKVS